MQLLYEATITDIQLDLNTYLKLLSQVYFDYQVVQFDRTDFITYLYTLFANDHSPEDFQLGTELLQDYIESNFEEFNQEIANKAAVNSDKSKKKGKKSKVAESDE